MSAITDFFDSILETIKDGLTRKPGRAVFVPGGNSAWDECDCDGQLALRIVAIEELSRGRNHCSSAWSMTLAAELVRCVQGMDDRGNPPKEATVTADGHSMADDMFEMYQTLNCVVRELPGVGAQSLKIDRWMPKGPMGQCAGGEWIFTLVWSGCGCPEVQD